VKFIKKDGSERVLNGRLGVKKFLRGGEKTVDPSKFITIYDLQNQGYRNINRDTILEVKLGGELFVEESI
jgi:hypothetical protein